MISDNITPLNSRPISGFNTHRKRGSSEFTNPVLKIWSRNQGFDDSEYMFHQLGNWPKKYMLNNQPEEPILKINKQTIKIVKNSSRLLKHRKQSSYTPKPQGKCYGSPWLYHPQPKSLFCPKLYR